MENVLLGLPSESKEDAIRRAGDLLVSGGYVSEDYVAGMLEREKIATTYMGMGLALPHGTEEAKAKVKSTGIVVLQYPEGVEFVEGEKARLVVGIAGKGDEHLDILAKLGSAFEDAQVLETLCITKDKEEIVKVLK